MITKEEVEQYLKKYRARNYNIEYSYSLALEALGKAETLEEVEQVKFVYTKYKI